MWTLQLAPDCDMALVHDDDLERILNVGNDRTVSRGDVLVFLLTLSCP